MSFKIYKINEKIPLFIFKTNEKAALSFVRFQEHYESSNEYFRKNSFTLREFKEWYCREYGDFTYTQDWGGFNFPSTIVKKFERGSFSPLFKREENIIRSLKKYKTPYYVIGTYSDGNNELELFLKHEIAHAFFFTSKTYKRNVINIINKMDKKIYNRCSKRLAYGYGENTRLDEIHAYLSTGDYCHFDGIKIPKKIVKELEDNLNEWLKRNNVCLKSLVKEIAA